MSLKSGTFSVPKRYLSGSKPGLNRAHFGKLRAGSQEVAATGVKRLELSKNAEGGARALSISGGDVARPALSFGVGRKREWLFAGVFG